MMLPVQLAARITAGSRRRRAQTGKACEQGLPPERSQEGSHPDRGGLSEG